jgi:hypothetical protein
MEWIEKAYKASKAIQAVTLDRDRFHNWVVSVADSKPRRKVIYCVCIHLILHSGILLRTLALNPS